MTIQHYSQAYENAHYAILERMEHAKRKHPEELRFETVRSECCEVWIEVLRGNHRLMMEECKDLGVVNDRLMEEIQRKTGVRIR